MARSALKASYNFKHTKVTRKKLIPVVIVLYFVNKFWHGWIVSTGHIILNNRFQITQFHYIMSERNQLAFLFFLFTTVCYIQKCILKGRCRLNAIKKRFWSLLILLLCCVYKGKLLKTTNTEERIVSIQIQKDAKYNSDRKQINLFPNKSFRYYKQ